MSDFNPVETQPFLDLVDQMVNDQWDVICDTSAEHEYRVRAFLLMSLALSVVPNDFAGGTVEILQQRLQELPPVVMVNTIHVIADAMATMLAIGFNPPIGGFEL